MTAVRSLNWKVSRCNPIKFSLIFTTINQCLQRVRYSSSTSNTLQQLVDIKNKRQAEKGIVKDELDLNIHQTIAGRRRFYRFVDIMEEKSEFVISYDESQPSNIIHVTSIVYFA